MGQLRVSNLQGLSPRGLCRACWALSASAGRAGCQPLAFPAPGVSLLLQNVLLQMGLHVLAVNGMLIRRARSYILRCHGCFRCHGWAGPWLSPCARPREL